jgi:DNA-binding MarR family transcriptional regulator
MGKRDARNWVDQPTINQIIASFVEPKTPKQVEEALGLKKLKLKPYLEKGLLKSLNPEARKSRFYVLTNKARRLLQLTASTNERKNDWAVIGWIMASPKQRHVILKAVDARKRTSEEIRERASRLNSHLTRISTKGILKQLIGKGLIDTEIGNERKRYYWITDKGRILASDIESLGIPHTH